MHTVFGEVTEGMDILMKINESFVDKDFVPYQDIRFHYFTSTLDKSARCKQNSAGLNKNQQVVSIRDF